MASMLKASVFALALAWAAPCAAIDEAGTDPAADARLGEAARLQRLSALAKLWGTVRYDHPALASRDADWDRALFEAIPRVDAARDAAQFRAALATMLAALDDPATRVLDPTTAGAPAGARTGEIVRIAADGVVHVDLARLGEKADAMGSTAAMRDEAATLAGASSKAKVLVLDARGTRPPAEDYGTSGVLYFFLRQALPAGQPLLLGSSRYRTYSGYPAQEGDPGSGGYSAGVMTELPSVVAGEGKGPLPPMVLVTDARTSLAGELLAGLQASGRARLVAVGGSGALGAVVRSVPLVDGVEAQVRTAEVVGPDGAVGLVADFEATPESLDAVLARAIAAARQPATARPAAAPPQLLRPDRDRAYATGALPPREQRLLALFRFWNVMERFFPYRSLVGAGWDDLLPRYIPQFEANRDLADYQLTLRRLVAEAHDSHVGVRTPMLESAERLGRHLAPAYLRYIEGKTVVAALVAEGTGLRVGDVVERIDGRAIEEARRDTGQYVAASTPQAWQRDLHRNLLRGQAGSSVKLDVRGLDGQARTVTLTRSLGPDDTKLRDVESQPRKQAAFGVLPSGYGYVDLDRLTPDQTDAMLAAIAGTPATIFDMRGYPHSTAWSVAPRLGTRTAPVAARFRRPLYAGYLAANYGEDPTSFEFEQRVPKSSASRYRGQVVMLIDENAQSQAEHTGMFFEAATDVTFIGTPTAGANGDVTRMLLPGGYAVSFSGHDVRHADGRQLQRVGLQPDVRVAPTIAGLARGEDEVLLAAEEWLRSRTRAR